MLGAFKDGRLRRPPLRGAFGILDRPCAPCRSGAVGTKGVPTIRPRPPAGRTKGLEKGSRKGPLVTHRTRANLAVQGVRSGARGEKGGSKLNRLQAASEISENSGTASVMMVWPSGGRWTPNTCLWEGKPLPDGPDGLVLIGRQGRAGSPTAIQPSGTIAPGRLGRCAGGRCR